MGTSAPTHKRNIANTPAKINDALEGNDFHDCPTDQYLCPMCRNVPELVSINRFLKNRYANSEKKSIIIN